MANRRFTFRQSLLTVIVVGWHDFLLKYHGSVLGYLWSLIGPIVKFLVIYYVTRPFVGGGIENYPLYLFLGIILFEHFSNTTLGCVGMLFNKESMVSKIAFPRILLPLMVGWTNLVVFLTYFLIFVVFSVFHGVYPTWSYAWLPVILLQMTLIALGIGMMLSAYSLKYRDIEHLWSLVLYVLFWLTPIFYAHPSEGPLWKSLLRFIDGFGYPTLTRFFDGFVQFQPLSILMLDSRRILLYSATAGVPSAVHVIGFTFLCFVMFWCGARVFQYRSNYFIEEY